MSKRLLLALGLWFAIMLVWTGLFNKDEKKNNQGKTGGQTNQRAKTIPKKKKVKITKKRSDEVLKKTRAAVVNTKKYQIGLNKLDGTIDSLILVEYKEAKKAINFIEKNFPGYGNFRVSFSGLNNAANQKEVMFKYKKLSVDKHRFTGTVAPGINVEKTYTFYPDKYYFDLSVQIKNKTGKHWKNKQDETYSLIWGSSINWRKNKKESGMYDKAELIYLDNKDSLEEVDEKDKSINNFKWVGLQDRYFLMSVIPVKKNKDLRSDSENKIRTGYTFIHEKNRDYRFSLNREKLRLIKNETIIDHYRVFLGPKKHSVLTADDVSKYHLDSIFTALAPIKWVAIGFEKLMYLIRNVVTNFGIIIILVTMLIKLLLHPLTHKSFVSMRKMQLIQPKMAALKEQFKNDQATLNRQMMMLYKKEGVNPMGGCLPMLLQLPIFIGLYRVLPRLVDLKNVSFLWIKDLSSPDTIFRIEAFRNIPILPVNINILPILMTAVSVFQTKLSSKTNTGASEQQKQQGKMMMMMPLIFLLLLWDMPSGLVLYWTVQNLFSIIEQSLINKKYAVPVEPTPAK